MLLPEIFAFDLSQFSILNSSFREGGISMRVRCISRWMMVGVLFLMAPLRAATFTVDNTGDGADHAPGDGVCATASGDCSLRAAIREANATAGADTIAFDIAGAGVHVIQPQTRLPAITDPVTLDGYTQP